MMYYVMTREKDAYSIDFQSRVEAEKWYDDHKGYITGEGSTLYDLVLVEAPQVRVGHSFKIRVFWRLYSWTWKPRIEWRFFGFVFAWLGLMINANREYEHIPGRIIRDHNNPPTGGEKK